MPLTDATLRAAKAKERPHKLADGRGLYVEISTAGNRLWRWKYRFQGKEKRLAFGQWPEVSLREARARCEEARALLASGVDPSGERKRAKQTASATFAVVAAEWLEVKRAGWVAGHAERNQSLLERLAFPQLGAVPVAELTAPLVLEALRRIEARGTVDAAHRVRALIAQALDYAVQTGRATGNPARSLRGALRPATETHFAAAVTPEALRRVLIALDSYRGTAPVEAALRLAPLLVVRPGELRQMEWKDIDFQAAEWRFMVQKTKTEHCAPLCRQALRVLEHLRPVTGNENYVFPNRRTRGACMSDSTLTAALRGAGLAKEEATGHGFRASFRTLADEILGERPDLLEHQLAHRVRDPLGRSYNRTTFLAERHKLMQRWADYLDQLRQGARIIPIRARKPR